MHPEQSDKKQQWQQIQQQAPEIAEFLTQFTAAFGKPAALQVHLADGTVIQHGEFRTSRMTWDGKLRPVKPNTQFKPYRYRGY